MREKLSIIIAVIFCSFYSSAQIKIPIDEASKHNQETVVICDVLRSGKFVEKSKLTIFDMGGSHNDGKITVVINYADRKNFPDNPEKFYEKKEVCITGKIIEFKGESQLIITKPSDIQIGSE